MYTSLFRSWRRSLWRDWRSGISRGSLVGGLCDGDGEVVGDADDSRSEEMPMGSASDMPGGELEIRGKLGRPCSASRAETSACRRVPSYKFSSDPGRRAVQM